MARRPVGRPSARVAYSSMAIRPAPRRARLVCDGARLGVRFAFSRAKGKERSGVDNVNQVQTDDASLRAPGSVEDVRPPILMQPAANPRDRRLGTKWWRRLRGKWRVEDAFRRVGIKHMRVLLRQRSGVQAELQDIPRRMQKVTNQARLVLELVDDFRAKRYRDVPWHAIAVAAGALAYSVSPADVVPDALPGLGAFDDMVVIALAMKAVRRHLEAYCAFKGYDPSEYF